MDIATIEIYRQGRWQAAAAFRPTDPSKGYRGGGDFEYLLDYAVAHAGPDVAAQAGVSCRYPVDFDLKTEKRWPAFLLDILPSGYGRQQWLEQLGLTDGPSADWPLLLNGAAFPPGNLRIAEAVAGKDPTRLAPTASGERVPMKEHPGFDHEAVVARDEYFVEYAVQHGIYAAGASDVQGVAPKLLLAQDLHGRWHAEGILPDSQVSACWIVKRPRGRTDADRKILRTEAAYMSVAQQLGLRVHAVLDWENDALFVPRFDRRIAAGKTIERLGMESLCSLAGVADYGVPISQDALCEAILRYCSDPATDLLEFIKRDVLNVVLSNKDNHARNTAVLRHEDGSTALSPLFDFAPMYLDPEGIARVCRWEGKAETAGNPDWAAVLARYEKHLPTGRRALRTFGRELERLPYTLEQCQVEDDIIEHCSRVIAEHARQLREL